MSRELENLLSDNTEDAVMGHSSVAARVSALARTEAVKAVQNAMRTGVLQGDEARAFVNRLLQEFHVGERFRFETSLAALAVAVRDYFDNWAEEYLQRLAGLKRPEFAYASAVARACLEARKVFPLEETRFEVVEPLGDYEQLDFTRTECEWPDQAPLSAERYEYV